MPYHINPQFRAYGPRRPFFRPWRKYRGFGYGPFPPNSIQYHPYPGFPFPGGIFNGHGGPVGNILPPGPGYGQRGRGNFRSFRPFKLPNSYPPASYGGPQYCQHGYYSQFAVGSFKVTDDDLWGEAHGMASFQDDVTLQENELFSSTLNNNIQPAGKCESKVIIPSEESDKSVTRESRVSNSLLKVADPTHNKEASSAKCQKYSDSSIVHTNNPEFLIISKVESLCDPSLNGPVFDRRAPTSKRDDCNFGQVLMYSSNENCHASESEANITNERLDESCTKEDDLKGLSHVTNLTLKTNFKPNNPCEADHVGSQQAPSGACLDSNVVIKIPVSLSNPVTGYEKFHVFADSTEGIKKGNTHLSKTESIIGVTDQVPRRSIDENPEIVVDCNNNGDQNENDTHYIKSQAVFPDGKKYGTVKRKRHDRDNYFCKSLSKNNMTFKVCKAKGEKNKAPKDKVGEVDPPQASKDCDKGPWDMLSNYCRAYGAKPYQKVKLCNSEDMESSAVRRSVGIGNPSKDSVGSIIHKPEPMHTDHLSVQRIAKIVEVVGEQLVPCSKFVDLNTLPSRYIKSGLVIVNNIPLKYRIDYRKSKNGANKNCTIRCARSKRYTNHDTRNSITNKKLNIINQGKCPKKMKEITLKHLESSSMRPMFELNLIQEVEDILNRTTLRSTRSRVIQLCRQVLQVLEIASSASKEAFFGIFWFSYTSNTISVERYSSLLDEKKKALEGKRIDCSLKVAPFRKSEEGVCSKSAVQVMQSRNSDCNLKVTSDIKKKNERKDKQNTIVSLLNPTISTSEHDTLDFNHLSRPDQNMIQPKSDVESMLRSSENSVLFISKTPLLLSSRSKLMSNPTSKSIQLSASDPRLVAETGMYSKKEFLSVFPLVAYPPDPETRCSKHVIPHSESHIESLSDSDTHPNGDSFPLSRTSQLEVPQKKQKVDSINTESHNNRLTNKVPDNCLNLSHHTTQSFRMSTSKFSGNAAPCDPLHKVSGFQACLQGRTGAMTEDPLISSWKKDWRNIINSGSDVPNTPSHGNQALQVFHNSETSDQCFLFSDVNMNNYEGGARNLLCSKTVKLSYPSDVHFDNAKKNKGNVVIPGNSKHANTSCDLCYDSSCLQKKVYQNSLDIVSPSYSVDDDYSYSVRMQRPFNENCVTTASPYPSCSEPRAEFLSSLSVLRRHKYTSEWVGAHANRKSSVCKSCHMSKNHHKFGKCMFQNFHGIPENGRVYVDPDNQLHNLTPTTMTQDDDLALRQIVQKCDVTLYTPKTRRPDPRLESGSPYLRRR